MSELALFADPVARTIRGLLLPYGELSSPSISGTAPVMFSRGTVELPADPSVVTLNWNHSQHAPRGRAIQLEETDAGVVAVFAVARTPEGDALLADATNPDPAKRPRLSAELARLVRNGAQAVSSALTGAAAAPQGAFPSAALFAIAEEPEGEPVSDAVAEAMAVIAADLGVEPDQLAIAVARDPADPETPETDPETDPTEEEETMNASATTVPEGLTPPPSSATGSPQLGANALFAAVAYARQSGDRSVLEPFAGSDALFAIAPIQHSGPSTVTIGADVQVPQAVGELWARRPYQRRYLPLFLHDTLTSMKVTGWKWDPAKTPEVGDYTGNTAEIPSNAVDTIPVSEDAERLAGGHKLDRRYIDFPDQGVYASYFAKMTESYARKSDAKALGYAVAAATAATPGTVPSGIAKGLAAVVDGALAVITAELTPTFAVVSPELWRDIVLTGEKDVLGYLNATIGLEEGSVDGFRLIPGGVGTGKVLVGSHDALTVYELGGGAPIRVEGLDPHHGAIDPALFGYIGKTVNDAKGLAIVTTV